MNFVEEYHNFYKNNFDSAFGVLVTKKYDYSYDFPAMRKIGDLENLKAVAVLHFSDFSKTAHMVNKIPQKSEAEYATFFRKERRYQMAQREFARASIDVIQETGKRNISACERCVGALGKLNAFWQGESPCRVRSSQPPLPSVAAIRRQA